MVEKWRNPWQVEPLSDMAQPLSTTRHLLNIFKSMIRFVLETCATELDIKLFSSSNTNGIRLRQLAVHHAIPSINAIPAWTAPVAHLITQALLRQKGKFAKAYAKAHSEDRLELPWSSLSFKGIPAWRPVIAQGPMHMLDSHIQNNFVNDPSLLPEFSCDDYVFSCPKCSATRDIRKCSLLVRSGWGHILCKTCRATSRSTHWHCKCNITWHFCSKHSQLVRKIRNDEP